MSSGYNDVRGQIDELKPGDRIEVERAVTVGRRRCVTKTVGLVVRTERRHHGPHCRAGSDETDSGDAILLELPDGELSRVTIDESTVVRPA